MLLLLFRSSSCSSHQSSKEIIGKVEWLLSAHLSSSRLPGWGLTLAAQFSGSHTDDTGVDGAGHAVLLLDVQTRQLVSVDGALFLQITSGRGVDDGADDELADGLILRDGTVAVGAPHDGGVPTPVLGAPVVSTLGRHLFKD